MRRHRGGAVDALRRGHEVAGLRLVDAWNKFLRIAVDDREPSRLDLNHESVALQKDVVTIAQRNAPFDRFVGGQRLGFLVAFEIAAPPNFHGDGKLVAVERLRVLAWLWAIVFFPCVFLRFFGIDIDQFHDEITISAGSRSEEIRCNRSGDGEIVVERSADESEYVRTMVNKTLVCNFPCSPVSAGIRG